MSYRTLITAALLGSLLACGDNDPLAENPAAPQTAAAADSSESADVIALKDSAAALVTAGDRPASSVCARRVAELRQVRTELASEAARPKWGALRSRELMLSAVISDACY